MVSGGSQLLLAEEGSGRFSTVLRYGNGTEKRLPATTPAKDLIAATEIDYRKCESRVENQRNKSSGNPSKDMKKQARKGTDQASGLDIGQAVEPVKKKHSMG